jgi:hypothetical protein
MLVKKTSFNLSKFIPVISVIIGFIIESLSTFSIGYVAKDIFILNNINENIKKRNNFLQLVIILSINAIAVIVNKKDIDENILALFESLGVKLRTN